MRKAKKDNACLGKRMLCFVLPIFMACIVVAGGLYSFLSFKSLQSYYELPWKKQDRLDEKVYGVVDKVEKFAKAGKSQRLRERLNKIMVDELKAEGFEFNRETGWVYKDKIICNEIFSNDFA
jgi:hypothetical protein